MSSLRPPPRAPLGRLRLPQPAVGAATAVLLVVAAAASGASTISGPPQAVAKSAKAQGQKKAATEAPQSRPGGGKAPARRLKQAKGKSAKRKAAALRPKAVTSRPNAVATGSSQQGSPPASAPAPAPSAATSAPASPPPVAAAPTTRTGRPSAGSRRPGSRRRAARRRGAGERRGRALSPSSRSPRRGGASPLTAARLAAAQAGSGRTARAGSTRSGPARREGGSGVTRTVRDIVEVVPEPVKVALAGLLALSVVLAGGYLIATARARRLGRQRAELLQEVGLLQTALLPPVPATVGAMRTSVAYRPSDGPGAGGDFYDALTLPGGRAAFILGDVSGHGRQALAQTAFIRYTLRAYIEAGLEPRLALQLASPVIGEHLGGDFATVVLAVHDPRNGSLTYACAGHPAPIVVGPTRPEPVIAASSLPIGLAMRTGVRQTTVPLPPGSVVCLYTDGLAEARTQTGILGRPRLADILEELGRDATAADLLDRVAEEARLVTDDMATVVLSPTAGVTAGGFREERLEVDLEELESGLGERFLGACGVDQPQLAAALAEARGWAMSHGAVVLHVRFGTRTPTVEVLPRNVESLEAASRRRRSA